MNYNVIPTEKFKKEAKRLVKKYPSLKIELTLLNDILSVEPKKGTPLGSSTFKIRIAIRSKGKGKAGGARIITYTLTEEKEVFLLTIYDKSELDAIDDKSLKKIIKTLKS